MSITEHYLRELRQRRDLMVSTAVAILTALGERPHTLTELKAIAAANNPLANDMCVLAVTRQLETQHFMLTREGRTYTLNRNRVEGNAKSPAPRLADEYIKQIKHMDAIDNLEVFAALLNYLLTGPKTIKQIGDYLCQLFPKVEVMRLDHVIRAVLDNKMMVVLSPTKAKLNHPTTRHAQWRGSDPFIKPYPNPDEVTS